MIATLPKTRSDNVPLKVPVWLRKLITISKIIVRHAKEMQKEYKRNASLRQSWANLNFQIRCLQNTQNKVKNDGRSETCDSVDLDQYRSCIRLADDDRCYL